jgi:hypothetical protein
MHPSILSSGGFARERTAAQCAQLPLAAMVQPMVVLRPSDTEARGEGKKSSRAN